MASLPHQTRTVRPVRPYQCRRPAHGALRLVSRPHGLIRHATNALSGSTEQRVIISVHLGVTLWSQKQLDTRDMASAPYKVWMGHSSQRSGRVSIAVPVSVPASNARPQRRVSVRNPCTHTVGSAHRASAPTRTDTPMHVAFSPQPGLHGTLTPAALGSDVQTVHPASRMLRPTL
jgi:hypothetical protein